MEAENAMLSLPQNISEKRFAAFAGTLGLHPLTNAVRGVPFLCVLKGGCILARPESLRRSGA